MTENTSRLSAALADRYKIESRLGDEPLPNMKDLQLKFLTVFAALFVVTSTSLGAQTTVLAGATIYDGSGGLLRSGRCSGES